MMEQKRKKKKKKDIATEGEAARKREKDVVIANAQPLYIYWLRGRQCQVEKKSENGERTEKKGEQKVGIKEGRKKSSQGCRSVLYYTVVPKAHRI